MPVLRAHLVQIKILENHQNGKDTHLRGLQIFARNDEDVGGREPVRTGGRGMNGGGMGMERHMLMSEESSGLEVQKALVTGRQRSEKIRKVERLELGGASRSRWDVEPSIR